MRKRAFIAFLLIAALFALGTVLRDALPKAEKGRMDIQDKDHGLTDDTIQEASPFLKDVLLIERLASDKSSKSEKKLTELAEKKDAVGYQANLILADRWSAQRKDAVPFYKAALALYDTREVRYKLAAFLAANDRQEEAISEYMSLLPDDAARKALNELNVASESIGRSLIERKLWKAAVSFFEKESENVKEDQKSETIEKFYARALAELGEYKKALPLLESQIKAGTQEDDLRWWFARCLEAEGRLDKAKEIYKALGQKGAYRLGVLLEKEGRLEEAASTFSISNEDNARWQGARLWEELGKSDKALESYSYLANKKGSYQDDAAYRVYLLNLRQKNKENEQMLAVIEKHPAWMKLLNKEPLWAELPAASYTKPDFLKKVEAYRESGRERMADIELAIGEKNAVFHEKLALGDWYLERDNYYLAVRWGMRALAEKPDKRAYELAYQRPYEEQVLGAASEFNIEANLIWALMREESHYRHDAVSWVGALGLMQIMPATGKEISSKLGVAIEDSDLLKPEINIRFGAFYLASMLRMFSGDIDKALAAYNGGAGNVQRWSKSKLGTSKEDFPTAVTFFETREYIIKVKNAYYTYQWLYGNK